jgi:RNA polymerase sigma-70 factor (ECF subfamily)
VGRYSFASPEELVRFCSVSSDTEAWEEFVRRFHRLIATVVLHTATRLGDSSTQTVDDLIQDTYLKLCADGFRLLRTFEARHSEAVFGYIKVITTNVVRDYFKTTHSQKRGARREVERHLDTCVTGTDRDRNTRIFWLYYRAGLSAGAIADMFGTGLTTKGVESIIFRLTKDLRARMAADKRTSGKSAKDANEGFLPAESL